MKTIVNVVLLLATFMISSAGTAQTGSAKPVPNSAAKPAQPEKPVGAGIIADMVREGDLAVGKDYTMALGGRFHHIHTKLMAIKCATCHEGVTFPENIQFLRRDEFPLAAYPGAVDRGTCMGCHRGEGSLATRIYGVKP